MKQAAKILAAWVFAFLATAACFEIALRHLDPLPVHGGVFRDRGGNIVHVTQDARPMIVMCLATRIADVPPFRNAPMQSDYAAKWDGSTTPSSLNWKGRLVESIPPLKRFFLRRSEATKNRKALTRID